MGETMSKAGKYFGGLVSLGIGVATAWKISVIGGTIVIVICCGFGIYRYIKYRKSLKLL
jgi:hypothetical protein